MKTYLFPFLLIVSGCAPRDSFDIKRTQFDEIDIELPLEIREGSEVSYGTMSIKQHEIPKSEMNSYGNSGFSRLVRTTFIFNAGSISKTINYLNFYDSNDLLSQTRVDGVTCRILRRSDYPESVHIGDYGDDYLDSCSDGINIVSSKWSLLDGGGSLALFNVDMTMNDGSSGTQKYLIDSSGDVKGASLEIKSSDGMTLTGG